MVTMKIKLIIFLCLLCWILVPLSPQVTDHLTYIIPESEKLTLMFNSIKDGIVYCYSDGSKTTGIFVSKDGWILTAGHKVDKDFPAAHLIHVKLTRENKGEIFKSTKIISPSPSWDLLLFKIDYKPKFYFKKFKNPHLFEENWIFGFRASSGKVPSSSGHITFNMLYPRLFLTTASSIGGNSGSPVLNRRGHIMGIVTRGYSFGDTLFIPADIVKKYIEENLK